MLVKGDLTEEKAARVKTDSTWLNIVHMINILPMETSTGRFSMIFQVTECLVLRYCLLLL